MAEIRKVEMPAGMTLEEVARLAMIDDSDTLAKKSAEKILKKPEKLLSQKYYRTVNIEVSKEELAAAQSAEREAKKAKKTEDEKTATDEKTSEDYKIMLRGMGFNV